ncbi:hypothetical protein ACA910_009838 [Epithemia clementina (nom. ined.)]
MSATTTEAKETNADQHVTIKHDGKNNDEDMSSVASSTVNTGSSASFLSLEEVERQLAMLPQVTVYEKAATPGGDWRSDRVDQQTSQWLNSVKESLEFFDYTFADHYGAHVNLPPYMPRKAIWDYMRARVTRNAPDFFDRYVKFQTEVVEITYNNSDTKPENEDPVPSSSCSSSFDSMAHPSCSGSFTVRTRNLQTGVKSTQVFDKCILAAGDNGIPDRPKSLQNALQNFKGTVLHSSEWCTTPTPSSSSTLGDKDTKPSINYIKGKHILVVGGSYSAEEVVLTALKHGAKRVTILVRHCDNETAVWWPCAWPNDRKVRLQVCKVIVGVHPETQAIQCIPTPDDDEGNEDEDDEDGDAGKEGARLDGSASSTKMRGTSSNKQKKVTEIRKVDTIVLCTGYQEPSFEIFGNKNKWEPKAMGDTSSYWNEKQEKYTIEMPEGWTMPDSELQNYLVDKCGEHVPPPRTISASLTYPVHLNWYHSTIFAYNPNYMLLGTPPGNDLHVLSIDINAHLCMSHILGKTRIPSPKEIVELNRNTILEGMKMPCVRMWLDAQYRKIFQKHHVLLGEEEDDDLPGLDDCEEQRTDYDLRRLAQAARDGNYPVDFGSLEGLSTTGQALLDMIGHDRNYNEEEEDKVTFRDLTEDMCHRMRSLFTGIAPVPLKQPWMDLQDEWKQHPSKLVHQDHEQP